MTTVYLVRHAEHQLPDNYIPGRTPGVHLSETGRWRARELAAHLAHLPIELIYSSPLERARETAAPIAERLGLDVHAAERINEVDFGDWTGLTVEELREIGQWHRFNTLRSRARIPGGELMLEIQARMVVMIEQLRVMQPDRHVALVSHGDVIKCALVYYLGMSLDSLQRIEVDHCSVSIIALYEDDHRILGINLKSAPLFAVD